MALATAGSVSAQEVSLQSAGALAFDSGTVLFVGDGKAGVVHAFDLSEVLIDQSDYPLGRAQTFEGRTIVNNLDVEIAAMLGVNAQDVMINDLVVHKPSKQIFLSVHRGHAPFQPGETYALVVSGSMQSAAGAPLGTDATLALRVGQAERRAIDPAMWQILAPTAGSHAPITVAFDRIMDSSATRRLLHMQDGVGNRLRGAITSDGCGWSFTPVQAWQADDYHLIVDPDLEDVSGNTIAAPFDAAAGTIGAEQAPIILPININ